MLIEIYCRGHYYDGTPAHGVFLINKKRVSAQKAMDTIKAKTENNSYRVEFEETTVNEKHTIKIFD